VQRSISTPIEADPSLRLRVTPTGISKRDYAVMLSAAKHLAAQRDRRFAAAQGDSVGADFITRLIY